MSALVIDIGGTHVRCAVADENASLANIHKTTLSRFIQGDADHRWKELVDLMVGYEGSVKHLLPPEAPVVLSFPGPIARPSRILSAPTVAGSAAVMPDLQRELSERTGRPTYLINDLSAAAWHISRTIEAGRFFVVTVSSGIGGKLFDRLHPHGVFDELPFAGEIGHLRVDSSPEAPFCDCGGKGHLGAVASGRGVERFARQAAQREPDRFARSACATEFHGIAGSLTNEEHLVPAALMRDNWALDIIRRCAEPLARVLLLVTAAAGLERVVVIGGFALSLGRIYLDILRTAMRNDCDYELLSARLPELLMLGDVTDEACLQGAAVYALRLGPERI